MPTVTIKELIEAAEKNGFPWSNAKEKHNYRLEGNKYIERPDTGFTNAVLSCVVGQGIINLKGTTFPEKEGEYDAFEDYEEPHPLNAALDKVYDYNDVVAESFEDAVKFMKETLAPFLEETVDI